ncbi:MAG: ABC transporter permease [Lachnospiraceae bacterium]|nr:ABC transporter permease [Lachnospiraceae bacterium]
MVVGYKDIFKMVGILICSFCAVFVCTLFLNYNMDLSGIENLIDTDMAKILYEAQSNVAKVVSAVSGGCLLLTTVVLLCFYIGHYIDTHKKQLGILKALGYSRFAVAKGFAMFGLSVFLGTAFGYLGAALLMPKFYEVQNKEGYLPAFDVGFHPALCLALVGLPAIFFALLAVFYSYQKLKIPALSLMRESVTTKVVKAKKESDMPFVVELKNSNIRQRKSLVFFIAFAVFCFSAMMQMSFSMDELASRMFSIMTMSIGFVLASVTLFIATTSIVKANGKTITMMKVFGYEAKECVGAVLGGYRPWAYIGFAIGTVYQYGLLKIAVTVIFADMEGVPDYQFDVPAFLLTLAVFIVLYESIMAVYARRMGKLSVKEIMLE